MCSCYTFKSCTVCCYVMRKTCRFYVVVCYFVVFACCFVSMFVFIRCRRLSLSLYLMLLSGETLLHVKVVSC